MSRLMRLSLPMGRILATIALLATPSLTFISPALAQSAAACDAARQQGRSLPGCPSARRPSRAAPPDRNVQRQPPRPAPARPNLALTPGAIAMRNALAAMSAREWMLSDIQESDALQNRIFALGTLSDMRVLAQAGNPRAQYVIGRAFYFGQNRATQDYAQAVEWYRRAAASSDPRGQYSLGIAYEAGHGVTQNSSEAVRLYRAAAAQGHAPGQNALGVAYAMGRGVTQNYSEAVRLYAAAVAQGYAAAQSNLGFQYETGRGVTQNYSEAVRLYTAAAAQGFAVAQINLGLSLYEGRQGFRQNQTEGLMWIRRAAAAGDQYARDYLTRHNLPLQ